MFVLHAFILVDPWVAATLAVTWKCHSCVLLFPVASTLAVEAVLGRRQSHDVLA